MRGQDNLSDPIVIRPSTLPKWDDCALRSAIRSYPELFLAAGYPLREVPSHIGAVVGKSVHAAGERLMRGKLDTDVLPSFNEAAEAAESQLEYELNSGLIHYDQLTPQQGTAARQIRRMVQRYRIDVADMTRPVAVEQRMKAKLKSGTILSGQMDSICLFPDAIRDTKTGRMRSWNAPQYGGYSVIARANGMPAEKILEDFIPRVSLQHDQPETQTIEIDRRHAERLASKIVTRIESQVQDFVQTRDVLSFPANPSSSLCKDTFCRAWGTDTCKEWRRE
jgi:hypothetical protein